MSCRTLREVHTTADGNGTGLPFAAQLTSWYLTELLGYTGLSDIFGFKAFEKSGTNGSFSGTSFDFTAVGANFSQLLDPEKWIVLRDDTINNNCGIFRISAWVSPSTVTLDWRSGTKEFPAASTGINWWLVQFQGNVAGGDVTTVDADKILEDSEDGECLAIYDGQGVNSFKCIHYYRQYKYVGGFPPGDPRNWPQFTFITNSWGGGIVTSNPVSPYNTLSGKDLTILFGSSGVHVDFTGTNPLTPQDIVDQIQQAMIDGGVVGYDVPCYESNSVGNAKAGGGYLTFRARVAGRAFGQPKFTASSYMIPGGTEKGGPANNQTQVIYNSEVWADLGFTGTSTLVAPSITPTVHGYDNRNEPGYYTPVPAATIAAGLNTDINAAGKWLTSTVATDVVDIWNTKGGTHGNQPIVCATSTSFAITGMQGAMGPSDWGDYFRCRTPHALGWEVEFAVSDYHTVPVIRVRVSTNGLWNGSGKIIGPVFFGSAAMASNWFYASGDTDGTGLAIFTHQATNNRYNGIVIGNLDASEPSKVNAEKVVLLGCNSNGLLYYDNGNFGRTYDSYHIGHGYAWSEIAKTQRDCWMLEFSYAAYANGWSKWTSRERNRRLSGSSSAGGGTGDSLAISAGVVTLTDAAGVFLATDVGKRIRITGATNVGNNGSFIVTTYVSATQIKFDNASGVNETSAFTWSMDAQDIFDGTVVVVDPNNIEGYFELLGVIRGICSVRGGTTGSWAVRKAFDHDGYLDMFHVQDGIAVRWNGVTPQH